MIDNVVRGSSPECQSEPIPAQGVAARRPPWLRVRIERSDSQHEVGSLLGGLRLHTVCEEARCPNLWECWGKHRTATFMILGDVCTRACRYCAVTKGRPTVAPAPEEPANVAAAVVELKLNHAVITSVDRDDLPDFGSGHFAATVRAIRERRPKCRVELLIPDFMGNEAALGTVLNAHPDVLGHNLETVQSLYRRLRPKGDYERALTVLRRVDEWRQANSVSVTTKSGLMVGLGEAIGDLLRAMDDLRAVSCDVLTVGQYLNPSKQHAPIARYYSPDEFAHLKSEALARGFLHCESGPLVRSSYHAHEHVPCPPTQLRSHLPDDAP